MLILKIQGDNSKSGGRYSPKEGQEELLELLVSKLPQYVMEDSPRAVWWKVFNPRAEEMLLRDVAKVTGGNFEIEEEGSPMKITFNDRLADPINKSIDEAISRLAGEVDCSAKRCEVLGSNDDYTLIKTPPIQGEVYISSKVYKVDLFDLSFDEVWDCGKTKLGRLLKEKLIKEELGK